MIWMVLLDGVNLKKKIACILPFSQVSKDEKAAWRREF